MRARMNEHAGSGFWERGLLDDLDLEFLRKMLSKTIEVVLAFSRINRIEINIPIDFKRSAKAPNFEDFFRLLTCWYVKRVANKGDTFLVARNVKTELSQDFNCRKNNFNFEVLSFGNRTSVPFVKLDWVKFEVLRTLIDTNVCEEVKDSVAGFFADSDCYFHRNCLFVLNTKYYFIYYLSSSVINL